MYKVTIIGAGVIGGLIARELSKFDMKVAILEKENDVAMGQSKANSGIVHAGYDPKPGTLKAKLNVLGSQMMEKTCEELAVKYKKNGALVVGYNDGDVEKIKMLYEQGIANGVKDLEILTGEDARKIENNLSKDIKVALYAPTSAVVCPYELTIESIGNAMDNGVELLRNFKVVDITKDKLYTVKSEDGREIKTEFVINCAGLYSDTIAKMIGDNSFEIIPRAGEYLLMDNELADLVSATIFRAPNEQGKGILATKTVDGNILFGPTAVERKCKEDESNTIEGIKLIKDKEREIFAEISFDKTITQFTGIRAHSDRGDFIIDSPKKGFINVAGIESPGLSAAPAIAEAVKKMLFDNGLKADKNLNFNPFRRKNRYERSQIICRCEKITKAEIVDAIRRNPGARDVDGIKRRTRGGMGRCQGGFCLPYIVEILSEELGVKVEEVTKRGGNSYILFDKVKEGTKK